MRDNFIFNLLSCMQTCVWEVISCELYAQDVLPHFIEVTYYTELVKTSCTLYLKSKYGFLRSFFLSWLLLYKIFYGDNSLAVTRFDEYRFWILKCWRDIESFQRFQLGNHLNRVDQGEIHILPLKLIFL